MHWLQGLRGREHLKACIETDQERQRQGVVVEHDEFWDGPAAEHAERRPHDHDAELRFRYSMHQSMLRAETHERLDTPRVGDFALVHRKRHIFENRAMGAVHTGSTEASQAPCAPEAGLACSTGGTTGRDDRGADPGVVGTSLLIARLVRPEGGNARRVDGRCHIEDGVTRTSKREEEEPLRTGRDGSRRGRAQRLGPVRGRARGESPQEEVERGVRT